MFLNHYNLTTGTTTLLLNVTVLSDIEDPLNIRHVYLVFHCVKRFMFSLCCPTASGSSVISPSVITLMTELEQVGRLSSGFIYLY